MQAAAAVLAKPKHGLQGLRPANPTGEASGAAAACEQGGYTLRNVCDGCRTEKMQTRLVRKDKPCLLH